MKVAKYTKFMAIMVEPEMFNKIKKFTDERKISISEFLRGVIDVVLSKIPETKDESGFTGIDKM